MYDVQGRRFSHVDISSSTQRRFSRAGGGGRVSNHTWSFTQPTRAKNYYVIASPETSVTQATGEFVYLSCSTRVVRQIRANLNADIDMWQRYQHWSSITESFTKMELSQDLLKPTVTTRNGKTWFVANHSLGNALDIVEARQKLQKSETYLKVKTEKFVFKNLRPFRKIITCFLPLQKKPCLNCCYDDGSPITFGTLRLEGEKKSAKKSKN